MPNFRIGEILAIAFIVAIVYVIVRPSSKAAELVQTAGQFVTALVRTATDTAK